MGFRDGYDRFDRYQRRSPWLGFLLAVRQKYSDDQGGYLAATITYYGFFSLFPLLLVLTTVLGFLLRGNPGLEQGIVHSALGQLPVIGPDLPRGRIGASGLGLALGIVLAVWSGMGVFLAAENAMNQLWGVPYKQRPDFFRTRGRALLLLLLLGGGALASTVLGAIGTVGAGFGAGWKVLGILLATAVDVGLFLVAFRVLTARAVSWRCLRGGALAAGIAYEALQLLGGWYVGHVLRHSSNVYGTFALVIGLLSWIYLAAHITLLAAEGNVVATRRLWPRSFSIAFEQPSTEADRRALIQRGRVEERRQDEVIDVRIPVDADAPTTREAETPTPR